MRRRIKDIQCFFLVKVSWFLSHQRGINIPEKTGASLQKRLNARSQRGCLALNLLIFAHNLRLTSYRIMRL